MNIPMNRREFGRSLLGVLGMYALGAPKNAKALEEGELAYYFNQFNTDVFAPFRTSGITPSDVQSRWRGYGDTDNASIENGNLRFNGWGGVRVAQYNGSSQQAYDGLLGPLELSARFAVSGEYNPNPEQIYFEFGTHGAAERAKYTITPGENPHIRFGDTSDA